MPTVVRLLRTSSRLLYAVLALGVAHYGATLLYSIPDVSDRFDASFAALRSLAVPGHFFFAALALALTPLQLVGGVRRRWPVIHRVGGMLYAVAILIAGVSAFRMAFDAQYGWVARSGFLTLDLLWVGTTVYAVERALARDFASHARWMVRSVALTSSAATLRIMLGLGVGLGGWPMEVVYPSVAWGCWLFNLSLGELWLARTSDRRWEWSLRSA